MLKNLNLKLLVSTVTIAVMAFLARASGGGVGAKYLDVKGKEEGKMPFNLSWLPELLFALVIGLVVSLAYSWWWLIPSTAWSYIWMQTGHGTVYNMKGWQSKDPNRRQTLEYVIRPIFNLFKWDVHKPAYSWAVMGLKGFLIGLPLFPFSALLGLLWPLAYTLKGTEEGEWYSGAFCGLCVVLFAWFHGII